MTAIFIATPDATFAAELFSDNTGSVTAVDPPAGFVTGKKVWKFNTAAGVDAYLGRSGVLADAGRRVTWWHFFDNLPAAPVPIWSSENSGGSGRIVLYLKDTGILELRDADRTAVLGTGTHALTTGIPYRISLAFVITSTTNYTFKVFLNGVQEISVANTPTLQGTGLSISYIGWNFTGTHPAGTNKVAYAAHYYIDDSTALTDLGDVRVTAKLPTTTVLNTFATTIGTGAVNERPISETNGKSETGTTAHDQTYDIEAPNVGDVDTTGATYIASSSWVWAKASSLTGPGTPKIYDRNSTSAVTLATTSALYTHLTTSSSYPTAGQSNVGMQSSGAAADTIMYECGMMIAYTGAFNPAVLGEPFGQRGARHMQQLLAQ